MVPLKKTVNTSFIVEFLVVCGLAAFSYGIYNYSLEEPIWSFNLWLIIDTICFVIIGGLIVFGIQVKDAKRAIFFLNIQTIIVSLGLILWGFDIMHKKRVLIRLEHFIGADADLIGKASVGIGVLIIVWTLSRGNIKTPPTAASRTWMCVNCLSPYSKQTITGNECPKCGGALEDLEGFYERHPDKQVNNIKSDLTNQASDQKPAAAADSLNALNKLLNPTKEIKEGYRALLVLIFLALIVLYALWQSFIVHVIK
jgi:hypothetical protein